LANQNATDFSNLLSSTAFTNPAAYMASQAAPASTTAAAPATTEAAPAAAAPATTAQAVSSTPAATSTPSLTDTLSAAYNAGDISTVNNILASNQLTSTDISNMFPGFDTSSVSPDVSYYTPPADNSASFGYDTAAAGGLMTTKRYARGGYAQGGISSLGTYSDGGRMLKGPGDGVSDSIPATIGGHQKAALADGEFVIPARIVSEIGNGSSDAGARKLYAMMDRIQNARKKTTKNVAANTRAEKYLPG